MFHVKQLINKIKGSNALTKASDPFLLVNGLPIFCVSQYIVFKN